MLFSDGSRRRLLRILTRPCFCSPSYQKPTFDGYPVGLRSTHEYKTEARLVSHSGFLAQAPSGSPQSTPTHCYGTHSCCIGERIWLSCRLWDSIISCLTFWPWTVSPSLAFVGTRIRIWDALELLPNSCPPTCLPTVFPSHNFSFQHTNICYWNHSRNQYVLRRCWSPCKGPINHTHSTSIDLVILWPRSPELRPDSTPYTLELDKC